MGISGGPDIIQDGLVLTADPADINSFRSGSTLIYDLSGNNNTGTLTNGPIFDSGSIKSIFLDGTNDFINFGTSSSLNITNNVSFDIWFKLGNNYGVVGSNWGGIISKRDGVGAITTFGVNHNGTGNTFQVFFNPSISGPYRILAISTSQYFSSNTWTHLSATYAQSESNTVISMYKNGLFATSSLLAGNVPSTPSINLTVGASYVANEFTNMHCGSVKVYNRALSASEVVQNYNATKTRFGL
jgi:hypothetical protein